MPDGLVPVFFEQAFGMKGDSWEELVVDLPGGRKAGLRGRIDRIDLGPDLTAPQVARLIAYKTGRAYDDDFAADATVGGTRIQPSAHAAAIRARYPDIAVSSGYWLCSLH